MFVIHNLYWLHETYNMERKLLLQQTYCDPPSSGVWLIVKEAERETI